MTDHDEQQGQHVTILADGEGQLGWTQHYRMREAKVTHLAALPRGMTSGKASVLIMGKLKDGTYAALQTSLRVMLGALALWEATYGIEADGARHPRLNDATRDRINAAMLLALIRDREGSEVTFSVDDLNALAQDPTRAVEVQYGADQKSITLRAARSE